ncbi:MAG: hypothetical protein AAFY28_11395, partial [Actinomycetota bacterium]
AQSGFALWPGVQIIPHFDEIPSLVVSGMRRVVGARLTVVGVNGNTALLKTNDGTCRVIGDRVTVWTATDKAEFGPGDLPDGLLP